MANTIKLKRASGSDPGNSDLSVGELAIRTSNCKLFSKNDGGSAVGIVAGSADTLTTARTIAGVSFDGSANISLNNNAITNGAGYITATLTQEQVEDYVGGMVTGNTETGITVTYDDSDGTLDFVVASQTENDFTTTLKNKLDGIESGATADQTKSDIDALGIAASTAATLATARTIAGVSFDGSANISLNNNAITNGAGYLADIVSDTSPQLGGDLDVQSSKITTATSNGNVKIEPDGTGVVEVRGAGGNDGKLQLNCSAQSHGIILASPAHSAGQSYTLIFPDNQIAADKYLKIKSISGSGSTAIGQAEYASLDANDLGEGTVPDARFPSTLPALNGSALTNLNGSNIASGTIAAARVATLNQDTTGTAAIATTITVADESSDTSCNVLFATAATGNLAPKSGTNLTFNSSSGVLTATGFAGALTGNVTGNASGSSGSCTGNAATATALETARTIAGVSFDGTANISLNNNAITNGAGYITTVADTTIAPSEIDMEDNEKIKLGASDDLQIYHDGTDSLIHNATNDLVIRADSFKVRNGGQNEKLLDAFAQGAVELYYDNIKKAETVTGGFTVTGTCTATAFAGDGSSLTGISAGATGGGSDEIFYENGQTVTTDYTITNGKNAMSAGPIEISSGVTVTVGSGETLTIV